MSIELVTEASHDIVNRWAFLVGVNRYRERSRFPALSHCVSDVKALAALLKQVGYGVVCLHDELSEGDERYPDRGETVIAELRKLRDKVGSEDLLLVYFAGHGTRSLVAGDAQPYLILGETRPTLPHTALAVAELIAGMRALQAKRQVLLLDACHIGLGQAERGDAIAQTREFVRNVHELATGFALLTPSTAQQTTRESAAMQHGVFSQFVLEGLSGQGRALKSATSEMERFVTVRSLGEYVLNRMKIYCAEQGYEQMPQGLSEGDLGDFILVDYRGRALPPDIEPDPSGQERAAVRGGTATVLPLGQQLKLEDRRQELTKQQARIKKINQKIKEGVDFEEEEKLEVRKNGIFQKINALEKEIARLEQGYE